LSFTKAGISNEVINRVYKCLFVYSTGFHGLLSKLLSHSEGKYRIVKSIWKTFAVLLEYCCQTDYESLLSNIETEYQTKQEDITNSFKDEIEMLRNREVELQETVNTFQDHIQSLQKEAFHEQRLREKVEKDHELLKENIENEVSLRTKFEDKVGIIAER